jgi:hypothetical protein
MTSDRDKRSKSFSFSPHLTFANASVSIVFERTLDMEPTTPMQRAFHDTPVQRELEYRSTWNSTSDHPSHITARLVQMHGQLNNQACRRCLDGAGPFPNGCVSMTFDNGTRVGHGACGNCVWGANNARCTHCKLFSDCYRAPTLTR